MRTIISGRVRQQDLDDAELLLGITPTEFMTNGSCTPPVSQLRVTVDPPCPMLPGELGERQRNYTMCNWGDALISRLGDDHLVTVAKRLNLLVYEVD